MRLSRRGKIISIHAGMIFCDPVQLPTEKDRQEIGYVDTYRAHLRHIIPVAHGEYQVFVAWNGEKPVAFGFMDVGPWSKETMDMVRATLKQESFGDLHMDSDTVGLMAVEQEVNWRTQNAAALGLLSSMTGRKRLGEISTPGFVTTYRPVVFVRVSAGETLPIRILRDEWDSIRCAIIDMRHKNGH